MIMFCDMEPSDLSFVLGLWHALLGGEGAHRSSRVDVQDWYLALRNSGRLGPRRLGSRWSSFTSLEIYLDMTGGLCAICKMGASKRARATDDECKAGFRFEHQVICL